MPALRVALAVLAVLVSACAHAQEDPFNVLHHLASKAPYWPLGSLQEQTPPPATCQPVHIDLVLRHGTRNPSDGDIEEFALLESAIALHADDLVPSLSWIAQWHNPIPLSQESDLAPVGRRENYQLGKRYMAAFPSLFAAQPYVSNLYYLRSTQEQRAMLSAESFAYGVFEGRGTSLGDTAGYEPVFIRADTESNDNVLKFYDNCPLYNVLVNDNDTANLETELYMDAIIGGITQRLTQTITSNGSWAVTREDALAMWAACQMEGNQHGVVDKWCALFTTQEILDFEYAEDLDDYWTKAYPYPINYEIVAPLLQDIVGSMLAVARGESVQLTNLRFAHSSTIVPLTTALGLFRDAELLTHDLPQAQIDARSFRTSQVSPKAGHVAFVLYECAGQYLVKVLHNEKEVAVDGCDGETYCPLDVFVAAYQSYIQTDFDELCAVPEGKLG